MVEPKLNLVISAKVLTLNLSAENSSISFRKGVQEERTSFLCLKIPLGMLVTTLDSENMVEREYPL